jgi:hypothetical protein
MFSGCLSTGSTGSQSPLPPVAPALASENGRIAPVEIETVIDFSDPQFSELWNSSPKNGVPRFFATVPRMADRDNEYERCMDMAAVQLSRFHWTRVIAKFATKTEGRDFGHIEDVEVRFDVEAASALREKLVPVAYYRDREASYMVLEYHEVRFNPINVKSELKNNLPLWVLDVPEIPGYITGLGAVGRYRYVAESIYQADKMALASIARQKAIEVKAKQENYEDSRGSTRYRDVNLELTDTVLQGAYIIARWRSLDGNNYYSLAIYPSEKK